MTDKTYTITFSRNDIWELFDDVTESQCDEIAQALEDSFYETFYENVREQPTG